MVKKALKSAIGVSVGVTIGSVILPRLLFAHLYNSTYPPIWQQAALYLLPSYAACFLVTLLIEWAKAWLKK